MRVHYDHQLEQLNQELTKMGQLCEQIIDLASRLLDAWDTGLVGQVKTIGGEIDEMERSIETVCMRKIITDLERIGDQAEDIVEILPQIHGDTQENRQKIRDMAKHAMSMVNQSVDAYIRQDVTLAKAVLIHDDIVDGDFVQIKKELIQAIARNPEQGEDTLDLLMIAKYFERIADHATNVAEWVIYGVTGTHDQA